MKANFFLGDEILQKNLQQCAIACQSDSICQLSLISSTETSKKKKGIEKKGLARKNEPYKTVF